MRLAVLLPVPQEQHLRGEGRIAVDGEERLKQCRMSNWSAIGPDDRIVSVNTDFGVDGDETVAFPFRLKERRREISLGVERGRQLDAPAASGEIEIGGQVQAGGV